MHSKKAPKNRTLRPAKLVAIVQFRPVRRNSTFRRHGLTSVCFFVFAYSVGVRLKLQKIGDNVRKIKLCSCEIKDFYVAIVQFRPVRRNSTFRRQDSHPYAFLFSPTPSEYGSNFKRLETVGVSWIIAGSQPFNGLARNGRSLRFTPRKIRRTRITRLKPCACSPPYVHKFNININTGGFSLESKSL